jgi:hypothetical protein
MEASWSILSLGFRRTHRGHWNNCRAWFHLLQTSSSRVLSCRLRVLPVRIPFPTVLPLRRFLGRPMALLPLEMGLLTPLLGRIGLRRPRLLYTQRTIRARRDHQRPVRPDDARPSATQPSSLGRTPSTEGGFLSLFPFSLCR